MIAETLLVWSLAAGSSAPSARAVEPSTGARVARPVGSLSKAFVLEAWARSHPGGSPPEAFVCGESSGCWLAVGHGAVDLVGATAGSCNAYFLALAREVPPGTLVSVFERRGFLLPSPLTPERAIGLGPLPGLPRISPAALLHAYRSLATSAWPLGDELRLAWLSGMARAARSGTGKGLGGLGLLAKTGTVPSLLDDPLATSGWALAADPAGTSAHLALLLHGTGAEAAERLGERLARRGASAHARRAALRQPVRIRLLAPLSPSAVTAVNESPGPISLRRSGSNTTLGAGSSVALAPGDRLGPARVLLDVAPYGLLRRVDGTLEVEVSRGSLALTLVATRRAWVDGLLRGEAPDGGPELREELAAAALRFVSERPRHGTRHVCDTTHCARFVGLGPPVVWTTPTSARSLPDDPSGSPGLDDEAWARAVEASERPGPSRFTGHCGGEALSPRAVWGHGSDEAPPCPRHGPFADAAWSRLLPAEALEAAFGSPVAALSAVLRDGVRKTRVLAAAGAQELLYDELHRLLAPHLGWDALPSPPDGFERASGGFVARGRGRGHRVGLCLADDGLSSSAARP